MATRYVNTDQMAVALSDMNNAIKAISSAIEGYNSSAPSLSNNGHDSSFKGEVEASLEGIRASYNQMSTTLAQLKQKIDEVNTDYIGRAAAVSNAAGSPTTSGSQSLFTATDGRP